ncbi:Crp/Fnr family transcriptional regulator [Bacillus sp. SN1]|uniref:Crp/Fnr family transcriptional regulator n=1 Tax=Bacillus sp. SN1 TaxID=2055158 RepID=UPI000C21E3F2|nr:Crp/Fnr family transcriptional regulator [Bacillus sp. SN1]PJH91575.1 Crp/Fnr family transcriptional regulator [Bacillus sp. SN1]PSI03184.1 Crp/Fnr family transcriptional regulator [Bacillus subtilis]
MSFFKSPQNSIEEHEQIIEACKEKDRKKAAELTYSNWIKPIQDIANKLMESRQRRMVSAFFAGIY